MFEIKQKHPDFIKVHTCLAKQFVLFCLRCYFKKKDVLIEISNKWDNIVHLLFCRWSCNECSTHRSLATGWFLLTGWISVPPPVMFVCGSTAQTEKVRCSPVYYNAAVTTVLQYDNNSIHEYISETSHTNKTWWYKTERVSGCQISLFTWVLVLYCSMREGMALAAMMWLALLEALQAAWSSLALGHTSFRSGSHRWCLQSGTTSHSQFITGAVDTVAPDRLLLKIRHRRVSCCV